MARHALQAGDLQGLLTPSRSRGRDVELAQARAKLADASLLALKALEALDALARHPRAGELWQEAVALVERAHGQAAALCSASISCAKALRWREALQLLTGKQDFSGERLVGSVVTLAVNCALNACAKKKQWQQALALLSSHRWVDTTSFNTAIAAVAKGGRWPLALALLWEMPRQQIRQDTFSFNSLFSGSRQRSWLISLALLEDMEAIQVCPDAVTYNSALKSSGGRHSATLLRRMRQQEVAPTAITFNTAISFCTSLSDAMALMEEMGRHSLQPTVVSLNSCIKVAEDWQQALEVLEQLEGRRLTSDVITFNSLLAHRPPNLQRVHAAMRTRRIQPDVVTWSSSISATGNWEEALACLTEASGDVDVAVLNAAISACGEASQWERALLLFSHDKYGLTPDVVGFNAAMAACDQGQQWDLALALLKALRDNKLQPSIISVSSVASACERAKHWPCALELLLLMAQVGLERDDVAFNTVMSAATNGQQWERALGVLQLRAFEMALSVVSCNAAISALAAGAQAEDAQEFLGRMKTLQLEPTSITWNSLMSASASARHWRSALAMLSDFKASLVRCEVLTFCKAVEALQGEAKLLLPQLQELRDAVLLTT